MVLFMVNNLSLDKKGRDRYNSSTARPAGLLELCTVQTLVGGHCMGLFLVDGQAGAGDDLTVFLV